jgi:hypothetical protein
MGGSNHLRVDCLACGKLAGGRRCTEHGNGCVPLESGAAGASHGNGAEANKQAVAEVQTKIWAGQAIGERRPGPRRIEAFCLLVAGPPAHVNCFNPFCPSFFSIFFSPFSFFIFFYFYFYASSLCKLQNRARLDYRVSWKHIELVVTGFCPIVIVENDYHSVSAPASFLCPPPFLYFSVCIKNPVFLFCYEMERGKKPGWKKYRAGSGLLVNRAKSVVFSVQIAPRR